VNKRKTLSRNPGRGRPLVIVVSGPSGAGKTTLCRRLLNASPGMVYSISCTTRAPRGGEVNGRDYFFLSEEEFARRAEAGEFLEQAVVHGQRYGTLAETVRAALAAGRDVLMDIDVQGAAQIRDGVRDEPGREEIRRGFTDFFVAPPSSVELEQRLVRRAEDPPGAVARRLRNAEDEMKSAGRFRHVIVNDDLDRACREMKDAIEHERQARD